MKSSAASGQDPQGLTYTAFHGTQRIASGPIETVALAAVSLMRRGTSEAVLVFSDSTGHTVDISTRGTDAELLARLAARLSAGKPAAAATSQAHTKEEATVPVPRGRGRPKLGVVAREVTLLPRHWEWLATQSGGASVALRKLVEEARRVNAEKDKSRLAKECAYRFMSATAGNFAGFEEAARAVFAGDQTKFREHTAQWPADVRNHAMGLAFGVDEGVVAPKTSGPRTSK